MSGWLRFFPLWSWTLQKSHDDASFWKAGSVAKARAEKSAHSRFEDGNF